MSLTHERSLRGLVIAGLVVAGATHMWLAPGHLAVSPALGIGFIVTGLSQASVAGLLIGRPTSIAIGAAVGLSIVALALYVVDVTVGLPGVSHVAVAAAAHGEELRHLSPPVDVTALIAKGAELATVVGGLALLARGRTPAAQAGYLAGRSATIGRP